MDAPTTCIGNKAFGGVGKNINENRFLVIFGQAGTNAALQ